jgi:PKD repeat protein
LSNIPRANVSASLTSGDPVPALTQNLVSEYVHARYADNTIPHTQTTLDVGFGLWTGDSYLEIFDDTSNASLSIEVTQPAPDQVKLRLPFHLRISNLHSSAGPQPLSPMGITGRIAITVTLVPAIGSLTVHFATATLAIEDIAAASGAEGSNYTINKTGASLYGQDLDYMLTTEMLSRAQAIVAALGDKQFLLPTVSQIETFIADKAHTAIIGRGDIPLWTPTPPAGGDVTVTDIKPLALSDAIAFCLNNPAGDTSVIANYIPAGRTCVIALDGAGFIQKIRDHINKPESEGGFGGLPHTEHNVSGHDAVVHTIDVSLQDGHIRIDGSVTVIDAIGCVDVDASFGANVGLRWIDNPDGTQTLQPYVIGDPEIDLSLLAWILSFLIGFLTVGIVGGIIGLVVAAVTANVAGDIGGVIVRDKVTGQVQGIGAWPQNLEGIGDITARFENPVGIDPQSVMFPDAFTVLAKFASTLIAFAQANGPYDVEAGALITFMGGPVAVDTDYAWEFGDGAAASGRVVTHTYTDDGIYVAKLKTTVNQPGGVVTRQFARVRARNVPPVVDAGPDLTIDEGQPVDFTSSFTDQQWLDTHTATFDFGDDTLPVAGQVSETNLEPRAQGTATAKHAYCDNGVYIVTIKVIDDDGGVGLAQRTVTVRNVLPTVDCRQDVFAYPGIPLSLEACFTDPGWCDTHTAAWEFGDCTPLTPAVVHEKHEPPQGVGVAAAIHIYKNCGTYLARCIVTDDDGGVGVGSLHVRVVNLKNADFESGFRQRLVGVVANDWEPYGGGEHDQSLAEVAGGLGQSFQAEEFIVHGGQRSQLIYTSGKSSLGIYQQIGANPAWDYQVSAWYHLAERGGGFCRLGIDPAGGDDPTATSVIWSQGNEQRNWAQLLVRITALAPRISIFLEVAAQDTRAIAYFDDVLLIPYPCPIQECNPKPGPQEQQACVDWKDEQKSTRLPDGYQKAGFTFKSLTGMPLLLVFGGKPANQGKLQFPEKGLQVLPPFASDQAIAQTWSGTSRPTRMDAYDQAGTWLAQATSTTDQQGITTLEVQAKGISSLVISGGGNEAVLIDLCVYQQPDGHALVLNRKE